MIHLRIVTTSESVVLRRLRTKCAGGCDPSPARNSLGVKWQCKPARLGQTLSLSHLAPFVDVSRKKIREGLSSFGLDEETLEKMAEQFVLDDIRKGVQTIQYQVVTLMTTNGQAPFLSVFMYLNEAPEGRTRDDLALVIEEVLRQRIQGVKNEAGAWITPAFPKLIYVLQDDNIDEGDRWFHLTRLAAECTAKRMVPDYISEKVMFENKIDANGEGRCYPCMGCFSGEETVRINDGAESVVTMEELWNRLSSVTKPTLVKNGNGEDSFIPVSNLSVYDTRNGFVAVTRMNRNFSTTWRRVELEDGHSVLCTPDHVFTTENRGDMTSAALTEEDMILTASGNPSKVKSIMKFNRIAYSYDLTTESEHFTASGVWSHNCRSFLTPYIDKDGRPKYYGRFNQGVVTLNLVDAALSANGDMGMFWKTMDDRLELCHRALRIRHERLEGTLSDAAPILWQHGALARLPKGARIDPLLHGGYSTLSLGYAGLWECVYALTGKRLTEPEGEALGLEIMRLLNRYTAKWREAEDIAYSLYGTPIESTTYRFAKCLQRRFGVVPGVTDRSYITNSYHVHVAEPIDAFSKLALEAKFQPLSPGGAISYVEVPDMQGNIEAVLAVMRFIYGNIIYGELNTKSDYCQKCGWDGEIEIVKDTNGKLVWRCPNCGNEDQSTMNVSRRTCGRMARLLPQIKTA